MIDFPLARLEPTEGDVVAALGLKSGRRPSPRSAEMLRQALELFRGLSEPRGISRPVPAEEFAVILRGQGRNAPRAPLEGIFERADQLHLFAFTLGERISAEIRRLFAGDDFALGAILDAVASLAADNAGRVAEGWAEAQAAGLKAYLYSPGYCGWHISGQEMLFAFLKPGAIGVSLNASFLMTPLKSISGVLVAGPPAIHRISGDYPFCAQCQSPTCRERVTDRSA
jgi:hypothetical protein